jgi:ankyrin repeat protein
LTISLSYAASPRRHPTQLLVNEMRVRVDAADHKGRTATHFAVLRNQAAALAALLAAGADVDLRCAAGDTPLHLAAAGRPGSSSLAALLLVGARGRG